MDPALHLIVVAGGTGSRAGAPTPKQFLEVAGRTLLEWSLDPFLARPDLAGAAVAVPADRVAETADRFGDRVRVCAGGATRTASTWCALRTLDPEPAPGDLVAVHDAARPFATAELIGRLIAAAIETGGAVPGIPVADTVVSVTGTDVAYLSRDALRAVQTPQVFRWGPFRTAHARVAATGGDFTDDGGLMAAAGFPPTVVAGDPANWKITTGADLERARLLLEARS